MDKLSSIINQYAKEYKIKNTSFVKLSGLSKGYISRLRRGEFDKGNVNLKTLIKIANGLNIPPIILLNMLVISDKISNKI